MGFDFERKNTQRGGGGIGRLTINGQPVGDGSIPHMGIASYIDTFDIGADRGSPVSQSYVVPEEFTGHIGNVRIRLE